MNANPRKRGDLSMLIIDRQIVVIGRRYRSKWWGVTCTCPKSKEARS